MSITKGKWVVSNRDGVYTEDLKCLIADCEGSLDGLLTSPETCKANAERICKCVNSHDALVAALRELRSCFGRAFFMNGTVNLPKIHKAKDKADEVLAQTKGLK